MNKIWLLGAVLFALLAFGSCKPKQSAYRAAYEQAKENESATPVEEFDDDDDGEYVDDEFADDFEVVSKPRTDIEKESDLNVSTRQERINPYMGENMANLKRFSVVVGSFRNNTNAYSLRDRMQSDGYNALVAQNELGMLRVIVSSFDSKRDALYSRDAFRSKYYPNFQDAWILERYY
ncbi:MAG: SPOR domain-containing protein [Tannerellaceae bacterium]|jgi:cell division protein FtsN|nr:SPOR domain-containing protein [Tannerellaceae bacterium]